MEARMAREKEERVELLRRQVGRRMLNQGIANGWSAWVDLWEAKSYAMQRLRGVGNRFRSPELAEAFSQWADTCEETRRQAQLAASLTLQSKLEGERLELDAELRRGGPSALRDRSVRVLGQLASFDAEAARAVIEHGAATLAIDTSALLDQPLVVGAQLQFIGELAVDEGGEIVLTARVARGVGDLDLELFGRALAAKREFERELATPAGAG